MITNELACDFTIESKKVLSFYMNPCHDGIVFGINYPNIGDIHFTILWKEGRLSSHITDNIKSKPKPPWGKQFEPEIFGKKLEKKLKRLIRLYHGNKKAWIMTKNLKKKLETVMNHEVESNKEVVPLEILFGKIECDFENRKRWKSVKIRDMLNKKWEICLIVDRDVIRQVIPLDKKKMICFSNQQLNNLINWGFDYFGFNEYLDYVKENLDKKN